MKKFILAVLTVFSFSNLFSQNCSFSIISYSYNTGPAVGNIGAKDFNMDGKMDFYTFLPPSPPQSFIACYLQTTPNNFSLITNTVNQIFFNSIIGSADLNNDGKMDILTTEYFCAGQGNGTFTNSILSPSFGMLGSPYNQQYQSSPDFKDFNNDGNIDLLTSSNLYLGLGNGAFSVPSYTYTNDGFESGLLNNDNILDIAISTFTAWYAPQCTITILNGVGNGSFTPSNTFTVADQISFIRIADMNSDGKNDLILNSSFGTNNNVKILLGNGTGSFSLSNTYYTNSTSSISTNYIAVADMNNDSYKDVVSISYTPMPNGTSVTHDVALFFNNGSGNLSTPTHYTFIATGNYIGEVSLNDFNSDNAIDIAINTWSSTVGHQNTILFSNPNCIWPGDANANTIANNADILEIGLQYNQTGAARTSTSNIWNGYSYTAWTGSVSTGKNKANADCNGDGVVNLDDTLAISNNYGFMHNRNSDVEVTNPDISIVPDQNSVLKNNWGTASIFLGDASHNISNIHGVAFTVGYDNTIIETDSVWIEYTASFINSNNLDFSKRYFSNGVLYTATTHTNQINAIGNGKIGILHYKIDPALATNTILNISISNASKLSATAVSSTLSSNTGTLNALAFPGGIKENTLNSHISIYPNPSSGQITIKQFDKNEAVNEINIYNNLGQLVYTKKINSLIETIDMSLPKGIYFYSLSNHSKQTLRSKLVIE